VAESRVQAFFYGSSINREVLAKGGCVPKNVEVARLWEFDIQIGTLATLARSDRPAAADYFIKDHKPAFEMVLFDLSISMSWANP
jgi:hypothetical protein